MSEATRGYHGAGLFTQTFKQTLKIASVSDPTSYGQIKPSKSNRNKNISKKIKKIRWSNKPRQSGFCNS